MPTFTDPARDAGEAYEALSDPQKRAAYDRYGHAAFQQGGFGAGGGFHDPFDLFREVLGSAGGGAGIVPPGVCGGPACVHAGRVAAAQAAFAPGGAHVAGVLAHFRGAFAGCDAGGCGCNCLPTTI